MIEQHRHGGSPAAELARFGLADRELIDFSANISPLGMPAALKAIWQSMVTEVECYPSQDGAGLRDYYCRRFDLSADNVLAGNGSAELIYLAPRALGIRRVAVVEPCFHDYRRASELAGAEVAEVMLKEADGFSHLGLDALRAAVSDSDAIFIGNPNNPTSTITPRDMILSLAEEFPDKWFFVDEAFVHFVDQPEAVTLVSEARLRPNLLIFRSETKFYALPGLRMGCVVGMPDAISRLAQAKEPWTVNRVAERIAPVLLECSGYDRDLRDLIARERRRVVDIAMSIPAVNLVPPTANFCFGNWSAGIDPDQALKQLLTNGVCLRDCRNFTGLSDRFFRFGLRRSHENDMLLAALAELEPTNE